MFRLVNLAGDTRIALEKEIVTLSRKAMVEAQITSVPFFALFVEIVDDLLKHDEADAALYHEVNSVRRCSILLTNQKDKSVIFFLFLPFSFCKT